ncbi:MAG: MOSC domain-containing protein [Saprospiraceae bacterium]|nr:MOSC domain-containing protein [Saprospiraceae bacterium]
MNLTITQLYTYPIKGMGGIPLKTAQLSNAGIKLDRAFMLVDPTGLFISQRSNPALATFNLELTEDGFLVRFGTGKLEIFPDSDFENGPVINGQIFQHRMLVQQARPAINDWFSRALNQEVYLVRPAEKRYVENHPGVEINFPDASQYLIVGEQSMELLNQKLDVPLPINRFRPNIVFSGGTPHIEDEFSILKIGEAQFEFVKPCGRCKVTTIDQHSGVMGVEPLPTLSSYRLIDSKILFGVYLKWVNEKSEIHLGANLTLL